MKLINKVDEGDFQGKLYETMLKGTPTYIYKIFYKVGKKSFCIDRSYVYLFDKDDCYYRMKDALDVAVGMRKSLFDLKGC